jgi:HlyD family secretion protein
MRGLHAVALLTLGAALAAGYAVYGQDSPRYITAPVERGSVATIVKATGTVDAVLTVDVGSQLSGRIADVFVDFNDQVKAGQPIARLDTELFAARVSEAEAALKVAEATARVQKAAVERARLATLNAGTARKMAEAQLAGMRARHDEAESEFQRKVVLARTGSVAERDLAHARSMRVTSAADVAASTQQIRMKDEAVEIATAEAAMAAANVDNAEAVVDEKRAALHQAQVDLERTTLRAPIDGVVIKRDLNPGQTVAVTLEAKTLFKIANDLREMQVKGKIDEADVGRLRVGQTARFSVDAYPDRVFEGRVLQIRKSPEVTQNVVTYTALITAPNPQLLLFPGMTAVLRIAVSETEASLKIPNEALRYRPEYAPARGEDTVEGNTDGTRASVWVLADRGQPKRVPVTIGANDESGTQLLAGELREGQPVIVGNGSAKLGGHAFGIRLGF